MTDQELITAIAKTVMGWTVLDRPVENNDTGETVFFWDEDKPVVAKAYETSAQMRSHGACNYGYMWHKWNPLTDPAAMFDMINAITAKGTWITMTIDAKETICSISLKGFHTQATTPGMALCLATIQWAEANQIETSANTDMLGILQEFMRTRWPDGARYAAIDSNGNVFCYGNQPQPSHTVWLDTVPPNKGDPSWLTQAGWLAIEDGADWKKLIIDRPIEEDKTFTAMSEVFAQMFALSDNLPAEYRWITCDSDGKVCAWKDKPMRDCATNSDTEWKSSISFSGIYLGTLIIKATINLDDLADQLIIDRQPPTDPAEYTHQDLT